MKLYLAVGNEIEPGLWEGDVPEEYMTGEYYIQICDHEHTITSMMGDVTYCTKCGARYDEKQKKWVR